MDPEQVLAFRFAGHHLHRRTDPLTAIAAIGLQEAPPAWAPVALHARATTGELPSEGIVLVNAMRGAPHYVPVADRAVFTTALVPQEDGQLKALVGSAPAKQVTDAGFTVREALDRIAEATRDALAGGPLERDDFHQALRERLPEGLLPWCRGCRSHHVAPGFWRALGPLGVTVMPARATYGLEEPPRMALETARAELVRRFLRCFGPATHSELASWAQTAPAHAKAMFAAVADELEEVDGKRVILAEDRARLDAPPSATGIRMLGGYDPFVGPDRSVLAPTKALHQRMFPPVGRPGTVWRDGELVALWRGHKKGEVLEVSLEWLGAEADVSREAAAVAALRGCAEARPPGRSGLDDRGPEEESRERWSSRS